MAMLDFPELEFGSTVQDPMSTLTEQLAFKLEERYSEVTATSVHSGTRVYKLLQLQDEYENIKLINCYGCTRSELMQDLRHILHEFNSESNDYQISIAPRGYKIFGQDVGSMAYIVLALVYSAQDTTKPIGGIFLQTYNHTREEVTAGALKKDNNSRGEFETE